MTYTDIKQLFLLHIKLPIDSIEKQLNAYTNKVYKIKAGGESFILKKYENKNIYEELILEKINIPEIIVQDVNYRIEKYIDHKRCNFKRDLKEIALALKDFHDLEIEDFIDFEYVINTEISQVKNSFDNHTEKITDILERSKIEIMSMLENNKYKHVLCHNDLQPNNILYTSKIILIDFEYSSMGECLFDIANLFCESDVDYEKCEYVKGIGYTKQEKTDFLKIYFDTDDVTEMLEKVGNLEIVSHYLWFIWGLHLLKEKSNEDFNYKNYVSSRLIHLKSIFSNEDYIYLTSILNES
ncbi:hypothetical protein P3W45_001613 [Vairimorpha bombi]|jgi:thiamine kinase-like enzyme